MGGCLFEEGELPERPEGKEQPPPGRPRLRLPVRDQMILRSASLDQLLPPEHEARLVWEAVSQLDVSPWLNEVKAVEGRTGRNATDPRVLLALWVYATLQGEGSARKLARLCEEHIAYQWLRGEVTLNYHTLADFRSQGGDKWDRLLSDLVASLMTEGLVTLHRVAQDGMRVRANAGKSSFRRKKSLEECQAEADEQVELLRRLAEENPDELTARQKKRPVSGRLASGKSGSLRLWRIATNWLPSGKNGPPQWARRCRKRGLPRPIPRRGT